MLSLSCPCIPDIVSANTEVFSHQPYTLSSWSSSMQLCSLYALSRPCIPAHVISFSLHPHSLYLDQHRSLFLTNPTSFRAPTTLSLSRPCIPAHVPSFSLHPHVYISANTEVFSSPTLWALLLFELQLRSICSAAVFQPMSLSFFLPHRNSVLTDLAKILWDQLAQRSSFRVKELWLCSVKSTQEMPGMVAWSRLRSSLHWSRTLLDADLILSLWICSSKLLLQFCVTYLLCSTAFPNSLYFAIRI